MKQTKTLLGIAAIVLLSAGVAGVTTYKLMEKNQRVGTMQARLESILAVSSRGLSRTHCRVHAVVCWVTIIWLGETCGQRAPDLWMEFQKLVSKGRTQL